VLNFQTAKFLVKKMQRLFGIETEYGITLDSAEEIDPVLESIELIRNYRLDDSVPKWDYSLEDPFKDARGFRAEKLKEHPDEKTHQKQDRKRDKSFA